jgi:hypothetical protein
MWWFTATTQRCSGCRRTDAVVNAATRRCLPCDGVELPETEADAREGCAECVRLFLQARAAVLTRDRSRLTDLRVMMQRHDTAEHALEPVTVPIRPTP